MDTLESWIIKTFKIIGGYTIQINFSDGTQKIIDFEPVIGKSWMKDLKDKKYFAQVILNDGGNLEWPKHISDRWNAGRILQGLTLCQTAHAWEAT
jgi:hypothetical protein